jgi:predicted transcriptional regulator
MTEARSYTDADIERIVRALSRPRGVLTRKQLVHEVRAEHWEQGRFGAALRRAQKAGRVVERAGEFYELTDEERSPGP